MRWLALLCPALLCPALSCLALLCLLGVADARPARVFAIVIGNNAAHRADAATLSFADDDAVRMHRLFDALPGRSILLARPDAATRTAHPDLRPRAPTIANLEAAIAELAPEIVGARAAGWDPQVYFFFAGHGDRRRFAEQSADLSYLFLDRPLSSRALYALLDRLPRARRHVLIDACHSLDLVTGRGGHPDEPRGRLRQAVGDFLDAHSLRARADVGVVVSATPRNTALESRTLRGGIYTHVVRSGLLGAADLDGDGRVGYGELAAFAQIATTPTDGRPRALWFFSEAPEGRLDAPLIDLRRARAAELHVPPAVQTRYTLHAADGAAYAGLNGASNLATRLLLVDRRDLLLLRWDRAGHRVTGELRLPVGERRASLRLVDPPWSPPGSLDLRDQDRGAAHRLFKEPFSHGLRATVRPEQLPRSQTRRVIAVQIEGGPPALNRAVALTVREALETQLDPARVTAGQGTEAHRIVGRIDALGGGAVQVELISRDPTGAIDARVTRRLPSDPARATALLAGDLIHLLKSLPPRPPAPAPVAAPTRMTARIEIILGAPAPRALPWTAIGVSIGALALMGAGFWARAEAQDAADAHTARLDCFDCRQDSRARFETLDSAATGLFIGAGAAALIGAGLAGYEALTPVAGPGVVGVGGRF